MSSVSRNGHSISICLIPKIAMTGCPLIEGPRIQVLVALAEPVHLVNELPRAAFHTRP